MAPLTVACLLALGAINAWLLAVVLQGDAPAEPPRAALAAWTPGRQQVADGLPQPRPISAYPETLARPVFYRSRSPFALRPPVPPPTPKSAAPPPPPADPGIALGGIIINGVLRKAYLFNRASPQGMWVGEGESFMGWTVASIDEDSARLQQSGRAIEVRLYETRR
jgi:hypothetical protein